MFEWYWVFLFYMFFLHIKAMVVTIYLHRGFTHNAIELAPSTEKVLRFLAWSTRLYFENFKQFYKTQHLKHHAYVDGEKDPHSPHFYTIAQLFDVEHNEAGRPYYISPEDVQKYASDLTTDISDIDKKLYLPYHRQGPWIWYPVILLLFGPIGLLVSLVLFPFVSHKLYIFIGNYCYHKIGYRNYKSKIETDRSRNFLPIGILFSGEELHANHHAYPGLPKFSHRWFEFDIGWVYIKILSFFKLVKIKHKI